MIRFFFLLQTLVLASPTILRLPSVSLPGIDLDGSIHRQLAGLSGGHDTCFLTGIVVQGKTYLVQTDTLFLYETMTRDILEYFSEFLTKKVDTGSTDTVIAHSSLNDFTGLSISYSIPEGRELESSSAYGDGSFWYGYLARIPTGLAATNVSATAPIFLMTFQSTSPLFSSGRKYQGLMGVAFKQLSRTFNDPVSVMDSWVKEGAVKKNSIAFHGCPYDKESNSWIDFGDDTPYSGCGNNVQAEVYLPVKSYYNIDMQGIEVGGVSVSLPATFQSNGGFSFFDSCTSNIMLPSGVLQRLQDTISKSGAIAQTWLDSGYITRWLDAKVMIPFRSDEIIWSKLPTLAFTINARVPNTPNNFRRVKLTLGPRHYIQANTAGYYTFLVSSVGDKYAILGFPIFSAYHIVVDRDLAKVTFQKGCGCETDPDSLPGISTTEIITIAQPPPEIKIADWQTCIGTQKCLGATSKCCFGNAAMVASNKTTCRPSGFCYTAPTAPSPNPTVVADWKTCRYTSVCSSATSRCCYGSASEVTAGRLTCRPAGSCYSSITAIKDWSVCRDGELCSSGTFRCCFGSATDYSNKKKTCRPGNICFSPPVPPSSLTTTVVTAANVSDWMACSDSSVCSGSTSTCCFGSLSGMTTGARRTCRPAGYCYTPTASTRTTKHTDMSEGIFRDIIPLTPLYPPSRIFAPFVNASEMSLIDFSNRTAGPFNFILGFVTADSENNAVWSEGTPLYSQELELSISSIRMLGGNAVLSFGGPNSSSTTLASVFSTPEELANVYWTAINTFSITWVDFFIPQCNPCHQTMWIRNQAIRKMQETNSSIKFSYTLPTIEPYGLTEDGMHVLISAMSAGARIDVVNVITNNITIAIAAFEQIKNLGISAELGVTAIQNCSVTVDQARSIVDWAKNETEISLVSLFKFNATTETDSTIISEFLLYETLQ